MAEAAASRRSKTDLLGNRLWGIVDLNRLKPCREPVALNDGTSFLLDCVLQALVTIPAGERPRGFLGLAGESRFLRTRFPEDRLSFIGDTVALLLRGLSNQPLGTPVGVSGDQYRIVLSIHADRDTVRTWIGEQNLSESREPHERKNRPTPEKVVADALRQLPQDYATCFEQLQQFQDRLRAEIAAAFQPILQQQAALLPLEAYADKQKIAVWVNSQLRELGLAIRCPQTGRPAILVADLRDAETQSSRFRLAIRDERGRQTKTISSKGLPELILMPDAPRRESRAMGPTAGRSIVD